MSEKERQQKWQLRQEGKKTGASCRWSGASGHRIVCQVVDMPISRLDHHILTPALLLPTATTGIPRLSLTPCVWERFLLRYALTRAKRQQQQQQQQQLGLSDSIRARWALLIGSRLSAAVIARKPIGLRHRARLLGMKKGTSMCISISRRLRATGRVGESSDGR